MRRCNCVAEFVGMAVAMQLGKGPVGAREIAIEVERELSRRLHRDAEGLVVTSAEARHYLPEILARYEKRLAFSIIRFREVPYAMYNVVLADLLKRNLTVGAGVSARAIFPSIGDDLHVVLISGIASNGVIVADVDLYDGQRVLEWSLLERAILQAESGYWVIGRNGPWRTEWV